MKDATVRRMSAFHTAIYRMTDGRIGRSLVNNDMLLLTTIGRTTGVRHTVPLLYLRDRNRLIVVASYGGRPDHPEWYRNLSAQPKVSIQIRGEHEHMEATTMTNSERSTWWPKIVDAYDDYAVYQSRTDRQIPIVWIG